MLKGYFRCELFKEGNGNTNVDWGESKEGEFDERFDILVFDLSFHRKRPYLCCYRD